MPEGDRSMSSLRTADKTSTIPAAVPEERRSLESAPARRSTLPPPVQGSSREPEKRAAAERGSAGLHSRWARRKCFRHIVFADSKHRRNFGKRYPEFPSGQRHHGGGWKQEGPEHGQLGTILWHPRPGVTRASATGNRFSICRP